MGRNVEFFYVKPGGIYSNQWVVNGSATHQEERSYRRYKTVVSSLMQHWSR